VEFALVAPLAILLVVGSIVLALGAFRQHQVTSLAREAARWASVHGASYNKSTNSQAVTATEVYNTVIAPRATGLDLTKLDYSVTWDLDRENVTVHLTYHWIPEIAFFGKGTINSTSVAPVTF